MSEESDKNNTSNPDQPPTGSPRKPVKSTAVVKYSAVQTPATFARLQCNTNLNTPPSNWLSSSAESYGLQNDWSPQSRSFSSFRMAHMFPDCVGEVDVVSEAENIKKLLKMPYTQGGISMVVHRVENTLLLDDFDFHRYLLRQAESDWEWLRKFFCEQIFQNLGEKEKRLSHKSSRTTIQQKNLASKFLYHSLVLADKTEQDKKPTLPVKTLEPALPEPSREEELPDPNCSHNFARNVLWTFENIQMLIGTDMPIFGGPSHPCISLRLRDMTKPISVLTGIDYWLDNLMSNVPEVVMCYHVDGIVQKYELIKTEDLPNFENAKFNSKVIRDVAQNILSFLKNNATKAGHTYWLFKGKDEEVVKLYDLTSLCTVNDDKGQSPFTVPVAMLLYRVARNMKYSIDYCTKRGTIRMLLKNCIELLTKEKNPQIITSAHYMLSDLYVPASTNPANPVMMEQDEDDKSTQSSSDSDKDSEKMEEDMSDAIKSLTLTGIKEQSEYAEFKYNPPPITGTIEEKCRVALEHVASGLECLRFFPIQEGSDEEQKSPEKEQRENEQRVVPEDDGPQMAKPFQAIPMPYSSLNEPAETACNSPSFKRKNKQKKNKKSKPPVVNEEAPKALLCKAKTLPTWQAPKKSDNLSWKAHLRTLLYEKATLTLGVLAENEYSKGNYGSSLRYISIVLRCLKILDVFCGVNNEQMMSYFLGRAGDCGFLIVQNWGSVVKHRQDYQTKNETSPFIDDICSMEEFESDDHQLLPQRFESLESTLIDSLRCYEKAMDLHPMTEDRNTLLRRVGNIHNELGVFYMNQASIRYQPEEDDLSPSSLEVATLLERSKIHLEDGVMSFETVHDESNLALLCANIGRLYRLRAHMHVKDQLEERQYYEKALVSYQKALHVLGERKCNPTIWDNVSWDFSTTLYTLATYLQDYPDDGKKSEEELEREVVDILQKALKYCEVEIAGPRQPIYQFRAATIHHRLASLYHRIYRETDSETESSKKKTSLQLCKLNYEKASKLFCSLEQIFEYLTVQMERVALTEFQAQATTTVSSKVKFYKAGLDIIIQCRPAIENMCQKNQDDSEVKDDTKLNPSNVKNDVDVKEKENEQVKEIADEGILISLLEQRLQALLQSLCKHYLGAKSTGNTKKECDPLAEVYKKCYCLSLRKRSSSKIDLYKHIAQTLKKIEDLLK